ncbi:MAG: NAD(+)/NADH kinase [Phycisphaerae bacterium]
MLGNPHKPEAAAALSELKEFASARCEVVWCGLCLDGRGAIDAGADRVVVIGGDGTLIGVARALSTKQIPLIGVNIGKLGFLAEFSLEELMAHFEQAICDDELISRRTMLRVTVGEGGATRATYPVVNDCVIQAGPPFRVITLGVAINHHHLTDVSGDGLIVCTPSGSTAHNLSAGGPIMQCGVDAIVLTPLCPHSLSHRPLVIERDTEIEVVACTVNEGTTAIIDGQVSCPLGQGDRVTVKRFEADCMLVRNPLFTGWHKLVHKLHWGKPPGDDQ